MANDGGAVPVRHQLQSGVIWEGDWMKAPLEGGYDMAEVDGPYALRKAAWDMMNIEGLAAWYRPHLFAERMVQASTKPGQRCLIPFGGTCRIATYLERLKRMEPENARYYDCAELNADGKDYLGAVLGRMGEDAAAKAGQLALFGVRHGQS